MATDEALDAFFSSDAVAWLIASARENRTLKIAFPKEINISNLLGWLFNPNEGHGLGDQPLKALLLNAWSADKEAGGRERVGIRPTEVHKVSFSNAVVLKEFTWATGEDRLDLVIVDQSNELLIGIENKYGARQAPGQLARYGKALSGLLGDTTTWKLVLVLLDSDEESEPEDDGWVKLSYGWVSALIRQQLELGHLSQESAATLGQFADHLDDEGLAPFPRIAHADATSTIVQLAHDHASIIAKMNELRSLKVLGSVKVLLDPKRDPLALEYIRHRSLWDHVLDVGARADVLVPVKTRFNDIESDLTSSRCQSYFLRPRWKEHWIAATESEREETIWPMYVTLYQSERPDTQKFQVSADVYLASIQEQYRDEYKKRALELRSKNGMSKKGLRLDTERIRIADFRFSSFEAAKTKLLEVIDSVDQSFFGRPM